MKKTHCIAGFSYYVKKSNLQRLLDTGCFYLTKTYYEIKPWWKLVFKRKLLYYEVICVKTIDISLDN